MVKIAIVGAGSVGCLVAKHLVRQGIGITLIDRDFVDASNLGRQVLYSARDVGMPKAIAAKRKLKSRVKAVVADLNSRNGKLLARHDIVLDCTDNFEARFLINDFCKKNSVPWIYAAVIRDIATVYCITPENACFHCIFGRHRSVETCDTARVSMKAVSAAAALQVKEALTILRKGKPANSEMLRISFPAGSKSILRLKVKKNPECPACSGVYEYLSGKKGSRTIKLCGSGTYQVKGLAVNLKQLAKKLEKSGVAVKNFGSCIHFSGVTLFSDGRAIIRALDEAEARSAYAKIMPD